VSTTADHPRVAMLRAYDKKTGKKLEPFHSAPQTGSPMTYVHTEAYIVVAVSGGPTRANYIAYTLPSIGMNFLRLGSTVL